MTFNKNQYPLIIAEAGMNHEGDMNKAFELISKAKESEADAIKFQLYHAENYLSEMHPLYAKAASLTSVCDRYGELIAYAHGKDIPIGFSIFTDDYLKAYGEADFIKIANIQLKNIEEILPKISHLIKPIFISIDFETQGYHHILTCINRYPHLHELITYLSVKNIYPHDEKTGIQALNDVLKYIDFPWGYSDHCIGDHCIKEAIRRGAFVIEKHFTLDHNQSSFRDHKHAFDPTQMREFVNFINELYPKKKEKNNEMSYL